MQVRAIRISFDEMVWIDFSLFKILVLSSMVSVAFLDDPETINQGCLQFQNLSSLQLSSLPYWSTHSSRIFSLPSRIFSSSSLFSL